MPSKARVKRDAFVQVPLWWAEQAAQATRTPQAMVWVWLLHLSWKEHSLTFKLPNERLAVLWGGPAGLRRPGPCTIWRRQV